jgi:hypothetical protein
MTRDTKCRRLLSFLSTGKSITAREASRKLGIDRLAAHRWELVQAGHKIVSSRLRTRGGAYVASYRLGH